MTPPSKPEGARRQGDVLRRIMNAPPVTIEPDASLAEAAQTMLEAGVGSLLVVDGTGLLVGIVTDGDFAARRAGIPFSTLHRPQVLGEWLGEEGIDRIYREARRRTVGEVMSPRVHSVTSDDSIERVLRLMLERDIKHVPVVEERKPLGMIARRDLLKLLLKRLPKGTSTDMESGDTLQ